MVCRFHASYPRCLLISLNPLSWIPISIGKVQIQCLLRVKLMKFTRVEVIGQNPVEKTENIKETDTETYSMVSPTNP